MTSENVYTEIVAERGAKVIPDLLRGNAGNVGEIGALLDIAADEIERLRAAISSLKNELREIDIAIDDPESNLTKTQAECVLKMHRTITHLREYAEHTTGCDSWAWPGGMKKPHAKCDCGYDALMKELEDEI